MTDAGLPAGDSNGGRGLLWLVLVLSVPGLMFLIAGATESILLAFGLEIGPDVWRRFARHALSAGLYSPLPTATAIAVTLIASRQADRRQHQWMWTWSAGALAGTLWFWGIMGLFGGM